MAHIDYAKPIKTVRLTWHFLAPFYNGDEDEIFMIAPVISTLFHGAWELYRSTWAPAQELKIYCRSLEDRQLFLAAAGYLNDSGVKLSAQRGGSWIHVNALASGG